MKQKWAEGEIELKGRFNKVLGDPVKNSGSITPSEFARNRKLSLFSHLIHHRYVAQ